jgi:hypothetical protein
LKVSVLILAKASGYGAKMLIWHRFHHFGPRHALSYPFIISGGLVSARISAIEQVPSDRVI